MIDTNEIYHHGVTGMKWGKRNGPPYPLNEKGQAKLAKQKKSANRSSGANEYTGMIRKKKNKTQIADYSKLSSDDIDNKKKQAIRDGNISEAYKNRKHYSDSELESVKRRYVLNTEVSKLSDASTKDGYATINRIAARMETVNRLTNAIAVGAGNMAKIYNAFAPFIKDKTGKNQPQVPTNNLAQYNPNTQKGEFKGLELTDKQRTKFEAKREKQYEKIAKKEGIEIDPNDKRRDTYVKAVIAKRNGWNKENTFTPEQKKNMVNNAKTKDQYDTTFLEYVQNKAFENMSDSEYKKKYGETAKAARLRAYKSYVNNPENFIDHELDKLKEG